MPRHGELVGRDAEIADLTGRLRAGDTIGVFAVEGMAGVGKTALAAEVVDRLAADVDAFPGGAAWISCEQLAGPDGLAELWSRVARAIGQEKVAAIPEAETRRAALAAALAARPRTLLALDNVEPQLDAALAIDTLGVKGSVALLLTARQQVAPDRLEPILLHPLPEADALTLFDRRLQQAGRAGLTDEERPAARDIVGVLGELPLAIEVTAAYAARQRLSLARVLDELREDRLDATALNQADPNRRVRLRFDRSWQALEPAEQRLFAGLSLLAGASFPRAAARALAAGPAGDLAALVAYALVEPLAGDRLRLHPLLREYAAAKLRDLGPAVESPLGDALLAYWLAYAEVHPGYNGMDALEAEAPGLMGALEWAHGHERDQGVLTLTEAIGFMLRTRGRRGEQLRMCVYADEAARRLGDLSETQFAAHQLAVTLADIGRLTEARAGFERALALARQLGDPAAEQAETHALAVLDAQTGNVERARAGYERALEIARQVGDPAAEQAETHELAVLAFGEHDLASATTLYEQALESARRLGDPDAEARELLGLGDTIRYLGETSRSRELLTQALRLNEQLGNPYEIGNSHEFLARLDRQVGDIPAAVVHYREALRRFEQVQSPDAETMRAALRRLGAET